MYLLFFSVSWYGHSIEFLHIKSLKCLDDQLEGWGPSYLLLTFLFSAEAIPLLCILCENCCQ